MTQIPGIDHTVMAVADMDAAQKVYQRLGFIVPPRGRHIQWGTGNWCMMFENDYLELRGIIDDQSYTHGLDEYLGQFGEGLMGVALATSDARANHDTFAQRGLHPQPVRELTRNFELPEGVVQPQFSLCFLDAAEVPGLMSVVLCQHLTPQLLRKPEWLQHPNQASGIVSMTGVVNDIVAALPFHQKVFGMDDVESESDRITINFPSGQFIQLLPPAELEHTAPKIANSRRRHDDHLVSMTLRSSNLDDTASYFQSQGIDYERNRTSIWVGPEHTCGTFIEFTADR